MGQGLLRIKLEDIRENPNALRPANRKDPQFIELVDSIRNVGVLNPIVVREASTQDGKIIYGLIEGLQRYSASLDAGMKDIPAHVITADDAKVLELQIIGNIHKIETKPAQYSEQLRRILSANPMMTQAELAAKLSRSTTWLAGRLYLTELNKSIQELLDGGKINLTNASAMAKLPAEEQDFYIERAMTESPDVFVAAVTARIKEIRTARRQGRDATPAEFQAVPHVRKLLDLRSEMETPTVGPILVRENHVTSVDEAFALGVKWAAHMDPRSVQASKLKDEMRKADLKRKQQEASVERAKKRSEEAALAAAKIGASMETAAA